MHLTHLACTKAVGRAEGAACYAALKVLLAAGTIRPDEPIVLFNTGSGLKYLECFGDPPIPAGPE